MEDGVEEAVVVSVVEVVVVGGFVSVSSGGILESRNIGVGYTRERERGKSKKRKKRFVGDVDKREETHTEKRGLLPGGESFFFFLMLI